MDPYYEMRFKSGFLHLRELVSDENSSLHRHDNLLDGAFLDLAPRPLGELGADQTPRVELYDYLLRSHFSDHYAAAG